MGKAPGYSYAVVLGTAFLALGLFFLTLLRFEIRGSYPVLLASGVCYVLTALFAFVWPGGSWRWGIWVSSGFWLFFGFVFISFMIKGEFEAPPLIEAILVAVFGCMGGILGRRLFDRSRGSAAAR